MRIIKHILAGIVGFCLISSCSLLQGLSSSSSSGSGNGLQSGISTGLALLNLYNTLKGNTQQQTTTVQQPVTVQQPTTTSAASGLDVSNISTLLNLTQLLTGAGTLQNATPTYTQQFGNGLIDGSSNLVNQNNVSSILGSLLNLNNIDTSSLLNAAVSAAATQTKASDPATATTTEVSNSSPGVSETLGVLGNIFSLL